MSKIKSIKLPFRELFLAILVILGNMIAQTVIIHSNSVTITLIVVLPILTYPLYAQLRDYAVTEKTMGKDWHIKRILKSVALVFATLFGTILLMALYTSFINILSSNGPTVSENQEQLSTIADAVPVWRMFILVCILAPIMEEYVFRYLFLQKWVTNSRKRYSKRKILPDDSLHVKPFASRTFWVTAFVQALIFGLIHVTTSELSQALITLPPYMFIGLGSATVYTLTGSSKYNILFHAIYNLLALSIMYL